jgi:NADH-quinone oxidoreductase subunit I
MEPDSPAAAPVVDRTPAPACRRASWLFKAYLPAVFKGLINTFRHLIKVGGHKTFTVQYPEEKRRLRWFRGEHRLKKDAQGREKCVACLMCQTVCPARCIHIVAEEAPWSDRDKRPRVFEIDMLRCIYCGMCEEACPCDAIELTPKLYTVSTSRQEMIYDKEKLLSN